jgi:mRNA interferase RelE/StbE
MLWKIELSKFVQEDLAVLDKSIVKLILKYMAKNIEGCEDPTQLGKPLTGDLAGLHRYRGW